LPDLAGKAFERPHGSIVPGEHRIDRHPLAQRGDDVLGDALGPRRQHLNDEMGSVEIGDEPR
jgi:hypothetical protein